MCATPAGPGGACERGPGQVHPSRELCWRGRSECRAGPGPPPSHPLPDPRSAGPARPARSSGPDRTRRQPRPRQQTPLPGRGRRWRTRRLRVRQPGLSRSLATAGTPRTVRQGESVSGRHRAISSRSMCTQATGSVTTPWRTGQVTFAEDRAADCRAHRPAAIGCPPGPRASADGSSTTIPRPGTHMRVREVPRSSASHGPVRVRGWWIIADRARVGNGRKSARRARFPAARRGWVRSSPGRPRRCPRAAGRRQRRSPPEQAG
jgi:hypothetical protein